MLASRKLPIAYALLVWAMVGAPGLQAQGSVIAARPLDEIVHVQTNGDTCLTGARVRARLAHWLRRDRLAADLEVEMHAADGVVSFSIRRGDHAPSVRSFDVLPQQCPARLDALTLALALAIDPSLVPDVSDSDGDAASTEGGDSAIDAESPGSETSDAETSETDSSGAETSETDSSGAETSETDSAETSDSGATSLASEAGVEERFAEGPPTRLSYALSLGASVGLGLVPGVSAVPSLSGEIQIGSLWNLRAGVLLTSRHKTELGRGEVSCRLVAGRADLCTGGSLGFARIDGCLGVGAGAVLAEGSGFRTDLQTTRPWVAGIARVSLTVPQTSRFAFRVTAEAVVPALRPSVQVQTRAAQRGQRLSFPSSQRCLAPSSSSVGQNNSLDGEGSPGWRP